MKYQIVTISVYLELRFIIDISWTSSKSLQKNSRNQNNKTMQTRLTRTSSAGQKGVHLERPPIKCRELRRLIIGGSGGKICSRVNESNSIGWLESQDAKKVTRHFNKNAEDLTYWMGDGKYNICRDGNYSIVNTNELARSLKDNLICKQCSDESMSNIVHNAVDEYSNYLERSLNISIPYHITKQFKSEDGKKNCLQVSRLSFLSKMLELHHQ